MRLAAIAAVALLAVAAGAVAGAFLVNGQRGGSGLGAGAAYVPADSAFYVETLVIPSEGQDAALREFLGHFPAIEGLDLGRPLSDQLVEHLDEMLAAEGATLTWSADIAPWFDGHAAAALMSLDLADAMASPSIPSTVVMLGVTDRAAADAAIDRIVAETGAVPTETDHAGTTIHVLGGDEPGAWALTDDQLIFGSDEAAVATALDAHANSSSSLAENADAARLAAALPSDWLVFVSYDLTGFVAAALEAAPEVGDGSAADAMRDLLEHQPLRGAMALSAGGDSLNLDATSEAPTGPFAVENADRGLADEVPGDALYYGEASNIGSSISGVIGPMKASMSEVPEVADQLAQIEAALGADLEELVTWIGDGAAVAGMNGAEPYAGAVLVPDDMDAAERRLDQLAAFAALGAGEGAIGVTLEEGQVGDATVTTLCWRDPEAVDLELPIAPEICLQWTVTSDRVVLGVGEGFVERVLTLDAGGSLAAQARFSGAVAEMGGAVNAGMAWLDLAGTLDAVESQLGSLGDEIVGTGFDEMLAWLEPLDQIVSVSRLDGDVLVQRGALFVR
jgi:hypothetical protein